MRLGVRRNRLPASVTGHQVVHGSHHKAGTVWLLKVLTAVAQDYRATFTEAHGDGPDGRYDFVLYPRANDFSADHYPGRCVRGSHMVRDPRDLIVSAYHYHLWAEERWVDQPRPEYDGASLRQVLGGATAEAGLSVEIELFSRGVGAALADWLVNDHSGFLELRYEDAIRDPDGTFTRLFTHYGFPAADVARCVQLARGQHFDRVTGRQVGQVQERSHLRSGQPGQWAEHFTARHREEFLTLCGDLLIRLGYETDDAW